MLPKNCIAIDEKRLDAFNAEEVLKREKACLESVEQAIDCLNSEVEGPIQALFDKLNFM